MKISDNCFAVTGLYYYPPWITNAGFVTGDKTTLVIDSGCSVLTAQTIYGYAAAAKPENKIMLINTEKHLDHTGGDRYFKDKGASIYGHSNIGNKQEDLIE